MKPYRKPFTNDPLFPFQLVCRETKQPDHELPDHLHDWYELIYVHRGKGVLFVDRTFYEMESGDLFVIPGNTIHRAFPDNETPVTSSAIFFDPILVRIMPLGDAYSNLRSFELVKTKGYKLHISSAVQSRIEAAIDEMSAEELNRWNGYRQALLLQLQQLLLLIYRHMTPAHSGESPGIMIGPDWMSEILDYIGNHPQERLDLSSLAKRTAITPAHFSRVFKKHTGMNVTDYVNAKRIMLAADMIQNADCNVDLIAENCGFNSITHFHRMFKKFTGSTPAVYKRQRKG